MLMAYTCRTGRARRDIVGTALVAPGCQGPDRAPQPAIGQPTPQPGERGAGRGGEKEGFFLRDLRGEAPTRLHVDFDSGSFQTSLAQSLDDPGF